MKTTGFLVRLACAVLFAIAAISAPAATHVVRIGNYWFNPTNLTVNVGDTVIWSNTVQTAHDSTSSSGLWASPMLSRSNTFSFKFNNPGTFRYVCLAHVNFRTEQTGVVNVVTAPNVSPSILFTSPTNGSSFTAPATIPMQADATDSDGTITNVSFLLGTTVISNRTTAPFAASASGVPSGNYTLSAIAADNRGARSTNTVNISVNNPPPPPSVPLSVPLLTGNSVSFSFPTLAGYTYEAQFATSISLADWLTFTNFAGTGSSATVTDTTATNAYRFYRVGAK